MALFVISYDLHQNRDYSRIIRRLTSTGAVKALESTWLAESNATAIAVRDDLLEQIDGDDSLLVIEIKAGGGWGSRFISQAAVDWLRTRVAA